MNSLLLLILAEIRDISSTKFTIEMKHLRTKNNRDDMSLISANIGRE